jgi:hypothetical protein
MFAFLFFCNFCHLGWSPNLVSTCGWPTQMWAVYHTGHLRHYDVLNAVPSLCLPASHLLANTTKISRLVRDNGHEDEECFVPSRDKKTNAISGGPSHEYTLQLER